MPRRPSLSSVNATILAAALTAAACGVARDLPPSTGSVDVGFIDVGNLSLSRVDYTISGNGIVPITGSISLVDPSATSSARIGGIPAGPQYLLELRAASDDGSAQCYGASAFDVMAGTSAMVTITLICRDPTTGRTITVNGMTDYCPSLASYAASPQTGTVGGSPISLTATAFSYYSDPPLFMWTASAGELSAEDSSVSSYTCTVPGVQTLMVTVTDGNCPDTATLLVTCLPAPAVDAAADAAGDGRG
jgi:hypothetical protein